MLKKLLLRIEKLTDEETFKLFLHLKNYLTGEVLLRIITIISVPVFTRLLTKNDYGTMEIYNSILLISVVLIGLNLHGSITIFYHERKDEYNNFLYNIVMFSIVIGLLELIIAYVFSNYLESIFKVDYTVIFLAMFVAFLTIPYNFFLSNLQTRQKSAAYIKNNVIRNFVIVTLSIFLVIIIPENKYLGRIYAQVVISVIVFFLIMRWYVKNIKTRINLEHIKYSLLIGVPLIPHTLSGFINQFFDKMMINYTINAEATGLYSVAVSVASLLRMLSISMNKAWVPVFYQKMRIGDYENIRMLSVRYFRTYVLLSLLFLFFYKEAFYILVDKKFQDALFIIPFIILANSYGPLYSIYANHSFYAKKTILISSSTIISAIVNIVLNVFFIPKYGYEAAAFTTLFSVFIQFLFHYITARFILKYKIIKLYQLMKYHLLLTLGTAGIVLVHLSDINYFMDLSFRVIILMAVLIVFYLMTRIDAWDTKH